MEVGPCVVTRKKDPVMVQYYYNPIFKRNISYV